jgi:hypothetical protein
MSLLAWAVVNAAFGVVLVAILAHLMSSPRHLTPHWVKALVEEGREVIDGIGHAESSQITDA